MKKNQNDFYKKHFSAFLCLFILLISIVYLSPTLHAYTPYRFDDAWFTSFIYNSYVNDIQTDEVYGGDLGNGMGGTQLFGKIYTSFYGFIASQAGNWSKEFIFSISVAFLALTSVTWYFISLKLNFSKEQGVGFVFFMLFAQTFFVGSHSVRPEMFVLFFASLALLCFLHSFYALCIILGFIATETHPLGSVFLFYIFPFLFEKSFRLKIKEKTVEVILLTGLTFFLCLAVYILYHYEYISQIGKISNSQDSLFSQNFILKYYLIATYYHTLPEFFLILITLFIYIFKGLYKDDFGRIALWVLCMVLFSILINRSTGGAYIVFVYPVFFFMIFSVFIQMKRVVLLILIIVSFFIPKYLYLYHRNSNYPDYGAAYQQVLSQNIPKDNIAVVGLPNDYWAFMDRGNFYQTCYLDQEKFNREVHDAWLLDHGKPEVDNYYKELGCPNLENINKNYKKKYVKSINYQGRKIEIYKLTQNF